MYFYNEEHEKNYNVLTRIYSNAQSNSEYRVNCYIASLPEIYKLLDIDQLTPGPGGPISSLMIFAEDGKQEFNHPGLTSSSKNLASVGQSLYNSHPVDLAKVIGVCNNDRKLFLVVVQALKIASVLDDETTLNV
ncbi:DUF2538 family protein [Halobacillus sp. A1]|uniref:DUF2538 family protein n=1 Tax=Halobacillus sp. A1 TaxID=2880262 RepID=UPI0020A6750F|nr:DUF2538 family protein [Halobacillus sp. A1]MCP3033562.1 DUF2538 family protein [Halobacillus sp. A1]